VPSRLGCYFTMNVAVVLFVNDPETPVKVMV
jgi:hypothetical protein